jgi:hypothetical protein
VSHLFLVSSNQSATSFKDRVTRTAYPFLHRAAKRHRQIRRAEHPSLPPYVSSHPEHNPKTGIDRQDLPVFCLRRMLGATPGKPSRARQVTAPSPSHETGYAGTEDRAPCCIWIVPTPPHLSLQVPFVSTWLKAARGKVRYCELHCTAMHARDGIAGMGCVGRAGG